MKSRFSVPLKKLNLDKNRLLLYSHPSYLAPKPTIFNIMHRNLDEGIEVLIDLLEGSGRR